MILPLALIFAAVAAEPELDLRWNRKGLVLTVIPPAGEHLSGDAEAWVELEAGEHLRWEMGTTASALALGWEFLPAPPAPFTLHGTLSAPLCTADGASCRQVVLAIDQALATRRGHLRWAPPAAPPPEPAAAPALSWVDALALAAADGEPLLLDFGATWCPPCQQLAAEVLHAPEHAGALFSVHLVPVDADRPESWELKDRFAVGGYPTLLLVDPEGREIARTVGYSGAEPFLAWLDGARGRPASLNRRLRALREGDLTTAEASVLALDLVRADRPAEARECLPRADDGEPGLRAALAVEQCDDCLRWLAVERADDFVTWIWDGMALLAADPALLAELRPGLEQAVAEARPAEAAEGLEALAELASDPAEARALHAQAAERFGAALSGDPAHDRGLWSEQAQALAAAGELAQATSVLDRAIAAYPHEFTYHWARAHVLHEAGLPGEAEVAARVALAEAYGDQRLRAVLLLGEILEAAGRPAEALAALDSVLADFARPPEGLAVRTWRYLGQIDALRARLESSPVQQ
ncbi:MAG: thioredoxin family protein [Pseudomonadota bacterium]